MQKTKQNMYRMYIPWLISCATLYSLPIGQSIHVYIYFNEVTFIRKWMINWKYEENFIFSYVKILLQIEHNIYIYKIILYIHLGMENKSRVFKQRLSSLGIICGLGLVVVVPIYMGASSQKSIDGSTFFLYIWIYHASYNLYLGQHFHYKRLNSIVNWNDILFFFLL